jgi:hypothetical protein
MVAFVRGDVNNDDRYDIADVVSLLGYLFGDGAVPTCLEATDVNDSMGLDVSDPIFLLGFLFGGIAEIPAPFPECGPDPDPESNLGCDSYPPCADGPQ